MAAAVMPDFSIIKFDKNKTENVVNLFKLFDAVLKHEILYVGRGELEQILCNELNIDFNTIKHNLRLVLIESLMYYMTVWPGWQRFDEYQKGQLLIKDWFERFRQYLILKTRFVIRSASQYVKEDPNRNDAATQTDVVYDKKKKGYAPYTICIAGPAPVLNNIVFVKSDGNVLVKQYPTKEWAHLQLTELYNWPNISIELKLPDVSLTRTIAHQVNRYMSLCGDMVVVPEVNHIVYTKKLSETGDRQSFSYDFMNLYFQHFNQILQKIPGIDHNRLLEINTLLSEYLQDVFEVDLCQRTMCTNMIVGYNMGKSRYVRSRKMVRAQDRNTLHEIINFYELVIPQVDFTLSTFDVQQDESDKTHITFKSLNKLEHKIQNDIHEVEHIKAVIHNCLIYKCTACCDAFIGRSARTMMVKHFELVHKGEQSVLCYKCHQEFSIQQLAGNRWRHLCKS